MPAFQAMMIGLAAPLWAFPTASADPLGDAARAAQASPISTEIRGADAQGCADGGDSILVCGRRGRREPRPQFAPLPGAVPRLVAGEPPSGAAALAGGGCIRLCHQPVKVDLIGTARTVARLVGRLLE